MGKIAEYTRQQLASSDVGTPNVMGLGTQMMNATTAAGGAINAIEEPIEIKRRQQQEQSKKAQALDSFTKYQMQMMKDTTEQQAKYASDPAKFSEGYPAYLKTNADAFAANIIDASTKQYFNQYASEYQAQQSLKAQEWSIKKEEENGRISLGTSLGTIAANASQANTPEELATVVSNIQKTSDDHQLLFTGEDEKRAIVSAAQLQAGHYYMQNKLQSQPVELLAEIRSGRLDGWFKSPDEKQKTEEEAVSMHAKMVKDNEFHFMTTASPQALAIVDAIDNGKANPLMFDELELKTLNDPNATPEAREIMHQYVKSARELYMSRHVSDEGTAEGNMAAIAGMERVMTKKSTGANAWGAAPGRAVNAIGSDGKPIVIKPGASSAATQHLLNATQYLDNLNRSYASGDVSKRVWSQCTQQIAQGMNLAAEYIQTGKGESNDADTAALSLLREKVNHMTSKDPDARNAAMIAMTTDYLRLANGETKMRGTAGADQAWRNYVLQSNAAYRKYPNYQPGATITITDPRTGRIASGTFKDYDGEGNPIVTFKDGDQVLRDWSN